MNTAPPKFEAGTNANPFPILERLRPHILQEATIDHYGVWLRSCFSSAHKPVELRPAREEALPPAIVVVNVSEFAFSFAAIGDGKRDRGADLDVEDTLIGVDAGSLTAPYIAAKIDDFDQVEALAQHLAQTGVRPAGQELAVTNEGDDASFRCILRLEQLLDCPAPECNG